MKSLVLSKTELLLLPEISLVLFVAVFVGALVWIFRPGAKGIYDRRRSMPLVDDSILDGMEESHGRA